MTRLAFSLLTTLPLLMPALPAQIKIPKLGEVIGLTPPPSTTGSQVVRLDMDSCKTRQCLAQKFPRPPEFFNTNAAAAYDPVRQGVWIGMDCSLACVDPASCRYICAPMAIPWAKKGLGALSLCPEGIGGLAFHNATNTLYIVDSRGFDLHQVKTGTNTDPTACSFQSDYCSIAANFPKNFYLGGLAIDQVRQLLFVGSYRLSSTAATHLYVASLVNRPGLPVVKRPWCGKLCDLTIPPVCPNNSATHTQITGLAFDSCRSILYITDSRTTSAYLFSLTGSGTNLACRLQLLKCCTSVVNSQGFHGLAVMPDLATSAGKSCTAAPCEACPQMVAGTRGDLALGNRHFAFTLDNAPNNVSAAVIGIGVGPCVTPGLNLGFCEAITINLRLRPLIFGVGVSGGTATCSGHGELRLPVGLQSQFCGLTLSTQWVVECRTRLGVGNGVTNCLAASVTSN
jgi:hypothetical protein